MATDTQGSDPRLAGVDPRSRRDVWVKKLLYPGHTVPTALAPVAVGVGLAVHDGVFAPLPVVGVLLFGYLVQLGGVLADNFFNLKRYRNDAEHPALVAALDGGVITLAEIRDATLVVFGVAAVAGLFLTYVGGVPVVLVGLTCGAISVLYSLEVTDVPLHDLYFFLFFGPVSVAGTYYVQAVSITAPPFPLWVPPGTLPLLAGLVGVPVGAVTTAILVVDNVRDLEFDRGKADQTLAVAIGERWSRVEYDALLVAAYLAPVALWRWSRLGPGVLLPLVSIPLAAYVAREMARRRTYLELLPMSPRTGQVLLAYSALLAFGLAV